MNRRNLEVKSTQRGFSLLMVLILLVVISLLGIAVIRSSAMQEKMGGNLRDRSLAFQGAETALRYAQRNVLSVLPVAGNPGSAWNRKASDAGLTAADCTNFGVCDAHVKGSVAPVVWMDLPAGAYDTRLAAAPQYRIEYIGFGPSAQGDCEDAGATEPCPYPMFRVTARSRAVGRAEVVLQAILVNAPLAATP